MYITYLGQGVVYYKTGGVALDFTILTPCKSPVNIVVTTNRFYYHRGFLLKFMSIR